MYTLIAIPDELVEQVRSVAHTEAVETFFRVGNASYDIEHPVNRVL